MFDLEGFGRRNRDTCRGSRFALRRLDLSAPVVLCLALMGAVSCRLETESDSQPSTRNSFEAPPLEAATERIELELPKGLRFRTIALTRTVVAALPRLSDTLLLMRARAGRSERWAALRSRDIPGSRAGFWSLAPTAGGGDEILVFDVRHGSVLHARISGQEDGAIETRSVRLQSDAALLGVSPLGRHSYIAKGLFQRVLLGVFDSTGALRDLIGAPPMAHDTVPIVVRQHAHQGKVVADSNGERIAVASIRGAVLSILRKDGRLIARASGRATFEPSYVWRTLQGHRHGELHARKPLGLCRPECRKPATCRALQWRDEARA